MANKSKNITKPKENITKLKKNKRCISNKLTKDKEHPDKKNKNYDFEASQSVQIHSNLVDDSIISRKSSSCDLEPVDNFEQVSSNSSEDFLVLKTERNSTACRNIISKETKMNAFQVMMLARNKVIGSNSPGKDFEKKDEICEEVEKKRDLKVKRTLKLQELANLKGASDNIEKEHVKYEYVEYCLKKRAKRLKNYMSVLEKKGKKKKNIKLNHMENISTESLSIYSNDIPEKNYVEATGANSKGKEGYLKRQRKDEKPEKHNLKKVKLDKSTSPCDIDIEKLPRNHRLNIILSDSEDDEFLSKLSPSIKRKSSVLSYFKKVEKPNESLQISNKKCKDKTNKKTSLVKSKIKTQRNKNHINDAIQSVVTVEHSSNKELPIAAKNKMEISVDQKSEDKEKEIDSLLLNFDPNQRNNMRPKRNIKKPVKYISDEDIDDHIFPPKKTKIENKKIPFLENNKISLEKENELPKSSKGKIQNKKNKLKKTKTTHSPKFAPIFSPKPEIRKKLHEEKMKFLHSGIPEILKKSIEKEKRRVENIDLFPKVVHSQQIPIEEYETFDPWRLPAISLDNIDFQVNTECSLIEDKNWKQFLRLTSFNVDEIANEKESNRKSDLRYTLQELKNRHAKFPVYRFYKILLKKNSTIGKPGNDTLLPIKELDNSFEVFDDDSTSMNMLSENLTWTDKYKPSSSFDIIGNFDCIKRLKKWLTIWKELNNEIGHSGLSLRSDSNSSSDFCYSDHDSTDTMKVANNVMILTGPPGSGKTSSVYAVANELSMNVLEVNASAKRTGKKIISDLLEATQSHIVHRNSHSQDFNSQSSIEIKNNKFGQPQKKLGSKNKKSKSKIKNSNLRISNEATIPGSQTTSSFDMSIVLVEDVDIVFEQDDGFIPALAQIVQNSKRPVLMISNSMNCFHLQRFVNSENVIVFHALSPKTLGTWLDLLILVESKRSHPNIGAALLNYYNGDMRKVVNLLQFWTESGGYKLNGENVLEKSDSGLHSSEDDNIDESSNQSWMSHESNSDNADENKYSHVLFDILKMTSAIDSFKNLFLFELSSFWWNIPAILNLKCAPPNLKCGESIEGKDTNIDIKKTTRVVSQLDQLSFVCDNNSVMDLVCKSSSLNGKLDYLLEKPWMSYPQANNSEDQDMASYNEHENFASSWCQSAVSLSLDSVRRMANHLEKDENFDIVPDAAIIKARSKILKDHSSLQSILPASCLLDRRALALDYYSALRSICRTEKGRSSINVKRNNRCSHYMKSLDRYGKSDVFDSLCYSLITASDHL